ncbi:MAG: cytochrome c oxidase subunit II [Pseudomonadota bacterium]
MRDKFKQLLKTLRGGLALLAMLPLLAHAAGEAKYDFPTPATALAEQTLHLHHEVMYVVLFMFISTSLVVIYSILNHRKSKGAVPITNDGPRTRSQIVWASVPFVILFLLDYVVIGIPAYSAAKEMEDTRTDVDMVIKVIGTQWRWQYEYPDEGISFVSSMATPWEQVSNEQPKGEHYLAEVDNPLVLPVGKKVRILTTATDVIHAWWVPEFAVKRDSIPGFLHETWVKIDRPGTYRGRCAQLCGKGHSFMPIVVEAVSEEKYKEWVAAQKAKMAPVAPAAAAPAAM